MSEVPGAGLADRIEWRPDISEPALVIDLTELFGEATGPDASPT